MRIGELAFIDAVRAAPDDDAVANAYADFLMEDNATAARGEMMFSEVQRRRVHEETPRRGDSCCCNNQRFAGCEACAGRWRYTACVGMYEAASFVLRQRYQQWVDECSMNVGMNVALAETYRTRTGIYTGIEFTTGAEPTALCYAGMVTGVRVNVKMIFTGPVLRLARLNPIHELMFFGSDPLRVHGPHTTNRRRQYLRSRDGSEYRWYCEDDLLHQANAQVYGAAVMRAALPVEIFEPLAAAHENDQRQEATTGVSMDVSYRPIRYVAFRAGARAVGALERVLLTMLQQRALTIEI